MVGSLLEGLVTSHDPRARGKVGRMRPRNAAAPRRRRLLDAPGGSSEGAEGATAAFHGGCCTASMSLSGATTASAPVSALSLPRLQEALPQAPGVCPGDGCRCPPPDVSLALGKRVVGPLRAAVRGVGRVPATATRWRVRGTSISPGSAPIRLTQARSPTCRCPRCLRRDWQSEASTSRSRRRGFPGRSTAGWRRTGRALADPDLPRSAQGTSPEGAWAPSRSGGISQCYGQSRSVSASVWPVVVEDPEGCVVGGRWYRPDLVRSDLLVIPPSVGIT